MKLVLFDIDGTLLWSDGAGRSAIGQALLAEMGMTGPIDGFRFDGKMDLKIVSELMRGAGHPDADNPSRIEAVCDRYVKLLERELANGSRQVRALPGVVSLLDVLGANAETIVGLLTGNIEAGARLKLRAAGIDFDQFQVGAFGSDAPARSGLPQIAAARAAGLMDGTPAGAQIVIIGDTPADVTCGAGIGARAIAVATGSYAAAELTAAGAHTVFEDLSDTSRVVAAILS
jgi:phosphoglycolate phosphatase-like HAD superfamily hydrolase